MPDSSNFKQNKDGKDYFSNSSHTSLELPSLVLRSPGSFHCVSSTASSKGKSIIKPNVRDPSSHGEQNFKSCGMESFRARLLAEGVSKGVADLIAKSRKEISLANYNSPWSKWSSWCDRKQIDLFL